MFCEPLESRLLLADTILFIRGASGSGGFLEGSTSQTRNEQLADINNTSTQSGNAGWGALAAELRSSGYAVEQMTEGVGTIDGNGFARGAPIAFESLDLTEYAAIVFGSNNAVYSNASVRAVTNYIRAGGAALFISDANFGSNWRDAADSDQQFLAHFSITVNQDAAAGTTTLSRSAGHFAAASHPVLSGVNSIRGEGVSPLLLPRSTPTGISITRAIASSGQTRNNDGQSAANDYQGTVRPLSFRDAALALVHAGKGRVAAYFDRNAFFNANGLGTDITEVDNRRFARNLFTWLADSTPPALSSARFVQQPQRRLTITFDDRVRGLAGSDIIIGNRSTGTAIGIDNGDLSVDETSGKTVLTIRISATSPAGRYEFRINTGLIADDSLNFTSAPIRLGFTIA